MGRLGAPFSTSSTQLEVVTDTDREGTTIGARRCISRLSVANNAWNTEIIYSCRVRVVYIYVLIATEEARALAQIVDRAHGEAIGFTRRRCINTPCVSLVHTAL